MLDKLTSDAKDEYRSTVGFRQLVEISLIVNPSCSKLPSTDFGTKKMGAPQVPSIFFGASAPNLVHCILKDIISPREVTPKISISCTDSLQTRSGVMRSVSNFSVRPPRFSLFNNVSIMNSTERKSKESTSKDVHS